MPVQACLPVKWLDRGYNLKPTHDFKSAFMIVDHDETDEALARLPIGNIFAPGTAPGFSDACGLAKLVLCSSSGPPPQTQSAHLAQQLLAALRW